MIFEYLVLAGIAYIVYLAIKYPDRAVGTKSRPDLRGHPGLPIFGNVFRILANSDRINDYLLEQMEIYGPNASGTIPGIGRIIACNSPECVEHILKTKFENYIKGPITYDAFVDIFGDGIFNSDGEHWKFQRKVASHLFQGRHFRDIICVVFEQESKIFMQILEEAAQSGETIDLQNLFFRFTMDAFGKICFNDDLESLLHPEHPRPFVAAFDYVQKVFLKRFDNPTWKFFEKFSKTGAKMRESARALDEYAYGMINKRRQDPEGSKNPTDILNLFMNAKDENGRGLSDKEIRDIILNLIVAGRDTTAQALSWMFYNTMTHPNVEQKLFEELNTLITKENPTVTYDNLKDFKYATATFYETLRLYPSVPRNWKYCIKDDILPTNVRVDAGDLVSWTPYAMGRSTNIWGPDAKEFIPERFLKSKDSLRPSQFKFISFNAGPRICLGQQFATIEALTLATLMLKSYRFELLNKNPIVYGDSITLPMKDPLLVKVHRRD